MDSNKTFIAKNLAKVVFGVVGGVASLLLLINGSDNISFAKGVDTLDGVIKKGLGEEKYSEFIDPLKNL